jgi:hypothetical protein
MVILNRGESTSNTKPSALQDRLAHDSRTTPRNRSARFIDRFYFHPNPLEVKR